jgi:hypothetical protein
MKRDVSGSLYVWGQKIIPRIRKHKTREYTLEGRSKRQEILKTTVHAIRQGMSTRSEIIKSTVHEISR